jgi:hypothetical protein
MILYRLRPARKRMLTGRIGEDSHTKCVTIPMPGAWIHMILWPRPLAVPFIEQ